MFKVFNTLDRKKESIKAISDKEIKLYTCGPTVYDYAHVGNLRAYVFADLLKRWLIVKGFSVKHLMNITDVGHLVSDADEGEDKMEVAVRREHKTAWELADFYTATFMRDVEKLKIIKPDIISKATDHIPEMISLVKTLEEKEYTYIIADGVYFDTSKIKDYGKLANLNIEGLKSGARVELSEEKKNPTDFALWKFSPKDKKRDMEWNSPFGRGFPGWHIECSAMSMKYLGNHFDIHTGGIDHINVHHTNEIAQSEAATGEKFVNYWLHVEHLLIEGQKVSKSLKNFILLKELEIKGYSPEVVRYFLLSGHYKSQINFSYETLDQVKQTLASINDFISKVFFVKQRTKEKENKPIISKIKQFEKEFVAFMDDDLNVSNALASFQNMITIINKAIDKKEVDKKTLEKVIDFAELFNKIFDVIDFESLQHEISDENVELLKEREKFRKEKKFKEADTIREILRRHGFQIEDTPYGARLVKK